MSSELTSPMPLERFSSLTALREVHGELLQQRRTVGDVPNILMAAEQFVQRGIVTGAILDDNDDRWAAQGLLNYWANILYRADRGSVDTTLAEFNPLLVPELPDEPCPYVGLEAFSQNSANKFFGRQELISRLLSQLSAQRLIAVVGPSGSGKSSIVQAGLLPALQNGALSGSENWHYLPSIVPGSDPVHNLEQILEPWRQSSQISAYLSEKYIQGNSEALALQLSAANITPIVLVIDQFEEIFTLCDDLIMRESFISFLLALSTAPIYSHRVILTMRSDFETFVARFPALYTLFEQGRVQMTPLSPVELREVIEAPAKQVGLKFEHGLVDLLVQDILGEPAGLPLLQFTLLKLWEGRERNRVTLATYSKVGGGRLALARSADNFYQSLIPEEQVTARRILLRMVRPGDGLEITSRRVRREELLQGGEDPGRVERVLEKLIASRLVRQTKGETLNDTQVEIAHEALVRNWPTLVEWLEQERSALATRRRLEGRVAEWVRLGQSTGGLFDEIELHEAERWINSTEAANLGYDTTLSELVVDSRRAIVRRNRRAANLRIAFTSVLLIATLVSIAFALYAFQQRQTALNNEQVALQNEKARATAQTQAQQEAATARAAEAVAQTAVAETDRQRETADVQRIAFAARSQFQTAAEPGLLLAIEAATREKNQITEQTLRDALESFPRTVMTLGGHTAGVSSAMFSPDGQWIATASLDHTVRLWKLNGQLFTTLQGHTDEVDSVVFSPSGQQLLTASRDRTARLWDINGNQLAELKGHESHVRVAVFSPDGQKILTVSSGGFGRLWDLKGNQQAQFTHSRGSVVRSAVFSKDGKSILTGADDATARLWDNTGNAIRVLSGHSGPITTAVFSPDEEGQLVLTASRDNTARLWARDGTVLARFEGHTNAVLGAIFSPNGEQVVTISADNTGRLWNRDGRLITTLQGHTGPIRSVVFSKDGQRILTASDDRTARMWSLDGTELMTLRGHTDSVNSAVFGPDDQSVLTASTDASARLWTQTDSAIATLRGHIADVISAVFSPNGKQILTASDDFTARLWDLQGKLIAIMRQKDRITSAVFNKDGTRILTAASSTDPRVTSDATARIWNLDGTELIKLVGHTAGVTSAVFSPDSQYILTASNDKTARLWDINGNEITRFVGHSIGVTRAVFSPDSKFIATAAAAVDLQSDPDTSVRIWDLSGQEIGRLKGHTAGVTSVVFSPDGKYILTASASIDPRLPVDTTAIIWDLGGHEVAKLEGHAAGVTSAVFSPDGQRILTASADSTARLWDLNGQQLAVIQGHTAGVTSAVFSPDGQRILTASADSTARLWDLNGQQLAVIQSHTDRVNSAEFNRDGARILTASDDNTAQQSLIQIDDLLRVAACRVSRDLTADEILRFNLGTTRFDFGQRNCPATVG